MSKDKYIYVTHDENYIKAKCPNCGKSQKIEKEAIDQLSEENNLNYPKGIQCEFCQKIFSSISLKEIPKSVFFYPRGNSKEDDVACVENNKKRLIELVNKMNSSNIGILLDYAYDLEKIKLKEREFFEPNTSKNNMHANSNIVNRSSIFLESCEELDDTIDQQKRISKECENDNFKLELIEFITNNGSITLVKHEEFSKEKILDDEFKVQLVAIIQNNTNKLVELYITTNYYDEDDVNVGQDMEVSPEIKPGKSWRLQLDTWVSILTRKYDLVVDARVKKERVCNC